MEQVLEIVAILCIGLMIGTEFAVSVFINPILEKLGENAQAGATRLFARKLGAVMPFWYSLSFLLLLAETITIHRTPAVVFLATASMIWVAVIIFTLLLLVPINNRIAKMDPASFSEPLRREHKRWDALHRWRVLALCISMAFMLLGIRL